MSNCDCETYISELEQVNSWLQGEVRLMVNLYTELSTRTTDAEMAALLRDVSNGLKRLILP